MNPSDNIDDEAAVWVVRLERGLTAAEQDQFLEWLGSDPRHGPALTEQRVGWTRLNLLADWRPIHGARPNRDLLAPSARHARKRPSWAAAGWMTLAAAAAAMIAFGVLRPRQPPATSTSLQVAAPPIGTIEERVLTDGTVITLNRGAELSVTYTANVRQVLLLRGEAHFAVARDPNRPFVVEAGGVSTRAVGTAFSVQLHAAAVQILVAEGKVDVQSRPATAVPSLAPTEPARVEAGQRCVVLLGETLRPAVMAVTPDELALALAWRPRLLDFAEKPLATILGEFNRHNAPYQIEVDTSDLALGDLILSASVRSDNVEGFLRLLEGGFGIKAERSGQRITLRRDRSQ